MLKKLLLGAAAFALIGCGPAFAVTIFSDNFNRAENDTVGNGWSEIENSSNDVAVRNVVGTQCTGLNSPSGCNNSLRLRDIVGSSPPDAQAAQLGGLSAVGLTGVTLSFGWLSRDDAAGGNGTESDDQLVVEWRIGSGSWMNLLTQALGNDLSTFTPVSLGLGAAANGVSNLQFRFYTNVSTSGEAVYLDDVLLSGNNVAPVPIPGALPLFVSGVAAIGIVGRRRRSRPDSAA